MSRSNAEYSRKYDDYTSDEYPPDWHARRQKALKRDKYVCQQCGVRSTRVDEVRFDVDHIIPKSDGGSHALDNLQTLCVSCHAQKHPNNDHLQKRAHEYKYRNQPPLIIRLTRHLLRPLLSLMGISDTNATDIDDSGRRLPILPLSEAASLPEGEGVTVEVTVSELWDSDSNTVRQMGRVTDAETQARIVIWHVEDIPWLREGEDYRFVGAKTNVYNGTFQLVIDEQTAVHSLA